jgi:hypothetical protein
MAEVSFREPWSKVCSHPKDAGGASEEREIASACIGREKSTPVRIGARIKRNMQREKTYRVS